MSYTLSMTTILGIKLPNRDDTAQEFQKIMTKYGCIIKTRLGLHSLQGGFCTSHGIILLEIIDDKKLRELEQELFKIDKIELQSMNF